MALARKVTVFLPAFNEVRNLEGAVRDIVKAGESVLQGYEVLIVDDGSTDGTGALADSLAATLPSVRVLHQPRNLGLAAGFRRALAEARLEYFSFLPGDHEVSADSVERIFGAVGSADIVVPYHGNSEARQWHRRVLTRVSTALMNTAFGMRLRYYQGPCIYPTSLVRGIPSAGGGFFFLTEILVQAIRAGHTYVEVPLTHQERAHGRSKAVSLRNIVRALRTIARITWTIRIGSHLQRRESRA